MNQRTCAECGAEAFQACKEPEQFEYKGKQLTVDVEFSVCAECGTEEILADQIKRNDCRTRDAWRQADGSH